MIEKYEFEDVMLDVARYEIYRAGEPVAVEPQVFDVLALLVTNHGRMMAKTEILDTVWGDQFVSESALSSRIKSARQAVGDNGRDQRIIRTVHGRGFRMVAEVNEVIADDAPDDPDVVSDAAPGPDLSAGDNEPQGAVAPVTNLPRSRNALVGRSDELDRALEQIASSDVVSIIGPGGAGKTSLALEVGRALQENRAGNVWFCGLASVAGEQVAAAVLDSLSQSAGSAMVSSEQIADRLGREPTVLILDNCEQVIEPAAKLVEELVGLLPTLTVLVTSREALDIRGEQILRIEGLPRGSADSAAVELFLSRAGEVTDLTHDQETRELAAQITNRLEGLPLAIELAAPQLASLTMSELLDALDDQLSLLKSRRRYDSRQAAMDDAIAWSFDLLTTTERATLLELGVFADAFTAEAAKAICSTDSVTSVLHRLVQQSVVVRVETERGSRYRLLEPIRQFANRRLAADAADAGVEVAERHARYFASRVTSLAADMRGPNEPQAAEALTAEWLDFGKSLAWGRDNGEPTVAFAPLVALEFHLLWQLRIEGFMWLEAAVEALGDQGDRQPGIDLIRGIGAWVANDLERSQSVLSSSVEAVGWSTASAYLRFLQAFAMTDFGALGEVGDQVWELAQLDDDDTWLVSGAAFKLISRSIPDPSNPEIPALAAEVDRQIEANDWPTGLCLGLLSHLTRSVRDGSLEEARPFAESLGRVADEAHVPWFPMTAGSLITNLVSDDDPAVQLEVASKTLRTAVSAGETVQMPAFLRSLLVGLEWAAQLEPAALILGLIPTVHGLGEDGVFNPGYDDAVARIEERFDPDDLDQLLARGRRLTLEEAADLAEAALADARQTAAPDTSADQTSGKDSTDD